MRTFTAIEEMRAWSMEQRRLGRRIAFVPTMGALHEGHLKLLREGRRRGDALVLSIYVNPTQFGPAEDFSRYPRDADGDLAEASREGVDAVFLPTDAVMYPQGSQTFVTVEEVEKPLCGASRPGHFRGVATVVAKLFGIVAPDAAIFGEKDFQQLVVIRRMVADLNIPVEIVGHPIVREADGLAMSSRNRYLSAEERRAALSLPASLAEGRRLIAGGEADCGRILARIRETIGEARIVRIDYASIVDAETLGEIRTVRPPALIAVAAFVGKTRLIDNALI